MDPRAAAPVIDQVRQRMTQLLIVAHTSIGKGMTMTFHFYTALSV